MADAHDPDADQGGADLVSARSRVADAFGRDVRGPVLAIILGWILIAALIGVGGDFPLSDDWSYAFAARALCETGDLTFLPWTGASLVLQAWYGAGVCSLFGFSFTWLRVSTLVLAAAGSVGVFLLLRHAGVRGAALAIGTLLFALNPLHVNLAFTFMTDVPFVAVATWAGVAYVRGLGERRIDLLLCGGLIAAAALLIRQHGILLAAAAGLAALLARRWTIGERLRGAIAAGGVPLLAFLVFHLWLTSHGTPGGYANKLVEAERVSLTGLANCAFRGLAYLGLFLCPLAPALLAGVRRRHPRLLVVWCALLTIAALALYLRDGALMFYLTNVLYDFGVGALTLRDTLFLGLPPPLHFGPALTLPLTVVAIASAGLLGAAWTSGLTRARAPVHAFLLLAATFLFAGTLLHTRYYFDRYLLAVLPFVLATTLVTQPLAHARVLTVVLAAGLGWYSVAGTHDYLAWNRARFAGLDTLVAQGVSPRSIDGGVEFNAWHLAPTLGTWPTDADVRVGQPATRRSWWWVVDDHYVVSFRPLPAYAVRDDRVFTRWLVPGTGHVLVLERVEGADDQVGAADG